MSRNVHIRTRPQRTLRSRLSRKGPAVRTSAPALRLDRVTRTVDGEDHIYETTLELLPGSLNVLLGPTLSGKTSLLRLLAGLDRPTTGRVLVGDRDVTGLSVRKRSVAMVYQQFINYPSFTVYENIASPLRRSGAGRAEVDRRVREMAAALHIGDLLDRRPDELSGGQQQRTALARALVKDAELLLLDEPLVNLDYKLREELRAELREIFTGRDSIVVYATTEPSEALLLGGSVVVLDQGWVLQTGPTAEVYRSPGSVRVGRVFSDPPMNTAEAVVGAGDALIGGHARVPLIAHLRGLEPGSYQVGVRSHHLSVTRRSPHDVEIRAVVELAEVNGSETFVHVSRAGLRWVVQEEGIHTFGLGEEVRVFVDPRNLFVFDPSGGLVVSPLGPAAQGGAGGAY